MTCEFHGVDVEHTVFKVDLSVSCSGKKSSVSKVGSLNKSSELGTHVVFGRGVKIFLSKAINEDITHLLPMSLFIPVVSVVNIEIGKLLVVVLSEVLKLRHQASFFSE